LNHACPPNNPEVTNALVKFPMDNFRDSHPATTNAKESAKWHNLRFVVENNHWGVNLMTRFPQRMLSPEKQLAIREPASELRAKPHRQSGSTEMADGPR
jgi:hypothetical protein